MTVINLYFDGASRGNPGSAGAGAYIEFNDSSQSLFDSLGTKTNNQAEYAAVILGLKYLKEHLSLVRQADKLIIKGDSQLVIKQLGGEWRVKSANIRKYYNEASNLIEFFRKLPIQIRLQYIPRDANAIADKLANQGADQN